MGLPSGLLWATCNIDVTQEDGFAASPFQYDCTMFSWGNIIGHNTPVSGSTFDYDWGSVNAQEPWYEGQVYGSTPGASLTASFGGSDTYDAARYNLGSLFRVPSSTNLGELVDNCIFIDSNGDEIPSTTTDKRVMVNGIRGIYLQSKINNNRIFFASSGMGLGTTLENRTTTCFYWTRSVADSFYARCMSAGNSGVVPTNKIGRHYGLPIRAVVNPNTINTGHNNHKYYVTKDKIIDLTLLGVDNLTTVDEVESWLAQNVGAKEYYAHVGRCL